MRNNNNSKNNTKNNSKNNTKNNSKNNTKNNTNNSNYTNAKDEAFAEVSAKVGIGEKSYYFLESKYLRDLKPGLERLSYETIPAVRIEGEKYVLYSLPRGDIRGLFLGHFTGCGQHLQCVAQGCATHGFNSPRGTFWVVQRKDKLDKDPYDIAAQAWVWRSSDEKELAGSGVVIDSIEGKSKYEKEVKSLFYQAALSIVGRLQIHDVAIGAASGRTLAEVHPNMKLLSMDLSVNGKAYKTPSNTYDMDSASQMLVCQAQDKPGFRPRWGESGFLRE